MTVPVFLPSVRKQEEYWLKVSGIQGVIPVLDLPTDFKRPQEKSFEGSVAAFEIGENQTRLLKSTALKNETTLYMVLLALYKIFLSKISGQDDIIVGLPTAGRRHADLQRMIGMFVNTLALRSRIKYDQTFPHFLKEITTNALKAFENQDYQFEELVEKVIVTRDPSRNPIFDAAFTLQNMDTPNVEIPGIKLRPFNYETGNSRFDMLLGGVEADDKLVFALEYCTKLFKEETIQRFINYFKQIAKGIAENPDRNTAEFEMMDDDEKQQLLYRFNDTMAEYSKNKTISRLFEEQVEKTPDNTALVFNGRSLTYQALDERSSQVGRSLIEQGVNQNGIVGIMMKPSFHLITGIIGILKAGGAYLPIDPAYPDERIGYMIKDSGLNILLTIGEISKMVHYNGKKIHIDDEEIYKGTPSNLKVRSSSNNLIYIIYTSGTTGRSKGVLVTHKNVKGLLFNEGSQFDFNRNDVWTLFHNICFDISVWEMYGCLLFGGKLILISREMAKDTAAFLSLLINERVTVLNQTPSAFYNLTVHDSDRGKSNLNLRYVIFGGEKLNTGKLKNWHEKYPGTMLVNMYGITETTVYVTYKEITENEINSEASNIGHSLSGISTYIFDVNLNPVPVRVPGELYVGGSGVAPGYLNQPELTKEKFIKNPFKPGETLYRSGDHARILTCGDMEYLGRSDRQVKIRGFRVELGEIENRLLKHDQIKEAVVLVKENRTGDRFFIAYFVASKQFTASDLKNYLGCYLVQHMIPNYFIQLENIPLTSSGKLNEKVLPEPEVKKEREYIAPRNDSEKKLAKIMAEVLGLDRAAIGIDDDFFELGGNSLNTAILTSKIKKELNVDLLIMEIFRAQTIREISSLIGTIISRQNRNVDDSLELEKIVL